MKKQVKVNEVVTMGRMLKQLEAHDFRTKTRILIWLNDRIQADDRKDILKSCEKSLQYGLQDQRQPSLPGMDGQV